MTGAGTYADLRRPFFAPKPGERSAIFTSSYALADDGQTAIVEFVAKSPTAFDVIKQDARFRDKHFEKGKSKKADIERKLKKYKKNFDWVKFPRAVVL